jgi:hypothetical protein
VSEFTLAGVPVTEPALPGLMRSAVAAVLGAC